MIFLKVKDYIMEELHNGLRIVEGVITFVYYNDGESEAFAC